MSTEINGLIIGSGSSVVTGPASAVAGDIAIFADATGKVLADSGVSYENFLFSTTFQSIWASTVAATLEFTRTGNRVTMQLQGNALAVESGAGVITLASSFVPTRFRPVTQFYFPVWITDNSVAQVGIALMSTTQLTIALASGSGNYTGTGTGGVSAFTVTYLTS